MSSYWDSPLTTRTSARGEPDWGIRAAFLSLVTSSSFWKGRSTERHIIFPDFFMKLNAAFGVEAFFSPTSNLLPFHPFSHPK